MARTKSTRAGGRSLRAVQKQFDDQLASQFLSARSALITAILAIEHQGVDRYVATNLRMHVLNPLDQIQHTVTGREVRS